MLAGSAMKRPPGTQPIVNESSKAMPAASKIILMFFPSGFYSRVYQDKDQRQHQQRNPRTENQIHHASDEHDQREPEEIPERIPNHALAPGLLVSKCAVSSSQFWIPERTNADPAP